MRTVKARANFFLNFGKDGWLDIQLIPLNFLGSNSTNQQDDSNSTSKIQKSWIFNL
jgi:hypothetical protein